MLEVIKVVPSHSWFHHKYLTIEIDEAETILKKWSNSKTGEDFLVFSPSVNNINTDDINLTFKLLGCHLNDLKVEGATLDELFDLLLEAPIKPVVLVEGDLKSDGKLSPESKRLNTQVTNYESVLSALGTKRDSPLLANHFWYEYPEALSFKLASNSHPVTSPDHEVDPNVLLVCGHK